MMERVGSVSYFGTGPNHGADPDACQSNATVSEGALASIVDQLVAHGWWGQIVGPHGSGKSTLLANLLPACQDAGRRVVRHDLHDRQRRLPIARGEYETWDDSTLVVVDGYEQLAWISRWRLQRSCRRRRAGLLITSHRCQGFPTLIRTSTSEHLLGQLVARLVQHERPAECVLCTDVSEAFRQHQGNLREALLQLYDVYEQRRVTQNPNCR